MNLATKADSSVPSIHWLEGEQERQAIWRSEAGVSAPRKVVVADDQLTADQAYTLACGGTAILWRGDFHNARQLLQAIARRMERKSGRPGKPGKTKAPPANLLEAFNLYRLAQSQRARILGMLLIPFDANYQIPLRRAPDVRLACEQAFGPQPSPTVGSLRELLGAIGAYEWRKNGVEISELEARIHPHYGVFSPIRGEYLELVAQAPLPSHELAFDIGVGTGVLSAILAKRGVKRVVATDMDSRALECARENVQRLGYTKQIELVHANLFPAGRAPLIVCNPPWLPARANSSLEHAVYDPDSQMLRGFLNGLQEHLEPRGEAWLIMSDLAERIGLRSNKALQEMFAAARVEVIARIDTRPRHGRASDTDDPLHVARSAEITSLWRLRLQ